MNEIVKQEAAPPALQSAGAGTLLTVIAQAAADPAFDLDRLERLFAMQRQVLADEAKNAFQQDMARAQAEMPSVVKNAVNPHLKSKYAQLEAIDDAIRPVYTRHGFSLMFSQRPSERESELIIVCTVLHKAGHSITEELPGKIDNGPGRSANQAIGSSITYLRRYLTCMIFNVVVRNEDKDDQYDTSGQGVAASDREVEELRTLIDQTGADIGAICGHYKVEKLSDMTAAQVVNAKARLAQRLKGGAQ